MKKYLIIAVGIAGLMTAGTPSDLKAENGYDYGYDNSEYGQNERPDFIYLPDLEFYVSFGSQYDMIYMDEYYYLYWYGTWYYSWDYFGPWYPIRFDYLPLNIRRHPWLEIARFRDYEYRRHDRRFWEMRFQRDRLFFHQHPPIYRRKPGGPPPPLPSKDWHFMKPFGPGGPPPPGHGGPGWNKGPGGPFNQGGTPPPPPSGFNKGPVGPFNQGGTPPPPPSGFSKGPVGPFNQGGTPPPPPSGFNKGPGSPPPPPPPQGNSGGHGNHHDNDNNGNHKSGPPSWQK